MYSTFSEHKRILILTQLNFVFSRTFSRFHPAVTNGTMIHGTLPCRDRKETQKMEKQKMLQRPLLVDCLNRRFLTWSTNICIFSSRIVHFSSDRIRTSAALWSPSMAKVIYHTRGKKKYRATKHGKHISRKTFSTKSYNTFLCFSEEWTSMFYLPLKVYQKFT